jgi:hypothetical protein
MPEPTLTARERADTLWCELTNHHGFRHDPGAIRPIEAALVAHAAPPLEELERLRAQIEEMRSAVAREIRRTIVSQREDDARLLEAEAARLEESAKTSDPGRDWKRDVAYKYREMAAAIRSGEHRGGADAIRPT